MNAQQIAELVADLAKVSPGALALARLLSFAAIADPLLIRRARLELLPGVEAGAEADLWFSPLIQTRSARGLAMYPEIAEIFRRDLPAGDRASAWALTREAHAGFPEAITVEEELNWLSLDPEANSATIRARLQSVISGIKAGEQPELAYWAASAMGRLPEAVRREVEARILGFASDVQQGRLWRIRDVLAGETRLPEWVFELLPKVDVVTLGARLTPLGLEFGPVSPESSITLKVPATDPRVLQVSWNAGQGIRERLLFIAPQEPTVPLPVGGSSVDVVTLAGIKYTITQRPTAEAVARQPAAAPSPVVLIHVTAGPYAAAVAWRYARRIDRCLGFVVERREEAGQQMVVAGSLDAEMAHTKQPIQRFRWIDATARPDSWVRYRVVPVLAGDQGIKGGLLKGTASPWSEAVHVGRMSGDLRAVFNRGLPDPGFMGFAKARGWADSVEPGGPERQYAGGDLRMELLAMLSHATTSGASVYAALHRLTDIELIQAMAQLGKRAQVILGRELRRGIPESVDAVEELTRRGVRVFERGASGHTMHDRFMVMTLPGGPPVAVWTGTTDWTTQHLCLAANVGIVAESPELASVYFDRWQRTVKAGNSYAGTWWERRTYTARVGGAKVTLAFGPIRTDIALDPVRRFIEQARDSVQLLALSLPPQDEILNLVQARAGEIYVRALVGTTQGSIYFAGAGGSEGVRELRGGVDMSKPHERYIVIDAFGDHPVVITGSSLSERAFAKNEEQLLIFEDARELAAQFAVRFATIYDRYRFRLQARRKSAFQGLAATDKWQESLLSRPEDVREQNFWLGYRARSATVPAPPVEAPAEKPQEEPEEQPVPAKKARRKSAAQTSARKSAAKTSARKSAAQKARAARKRRTERAISAEKASLRQSSRTVRAKSRRASQRRVKRRKARDSRLRK